MSIVKREIKIADVTGMTPADIETAFNNIYGNIGWRIIQVKVLGSNTYIILEREI